MINIDANFKEMNSFIGSLPKQLNYGSSVGLNNLATHMRDSELAGAKNALTLRGRWYEPRSRFGFNVQFAKKNDLNAAVFTKADWLVLHTIGGGKTPSGSNLAMPTQFLKRNNKSIITKANRPRSLESIGAFKHTFSKTGKGKGRTAIVKRYNDGSKNRIVVLYWLEQKAKIKKDYDFYEIGQKIYDRNALKYINDAIDMALRGMK